MFMQAKTPFEDDASIEQWKRQKLEKEFASRITVFLSLLLKHEV